VNNLSFPKGIFIIITPRTNSELKEPVVDKKEETTCREADRGKPIGSEQAKRY